MTNLHNSVAGCFRFFACAAVLGMSFPVFAAVETFTVDGLVYCPNKNGAQLRGFDADNPPVDVVVPDYVDWTHVVSWKILMYDPSEEERMELQNEGFVEVDSGTWWKYATDTYAVNEIRSYAFNNCESILTVSLPDTLTFVWGFKGCSNLKNVRLPKNCQTVGAEAFANCTSLVGIAFPESVSEIYAWAFKGCTNLRTIVFPEGLTTILSQAFNGCTSLTELAIPQSVSSMYLAAFGNCSSLSRVVFEGHVPNVSGASGKDVIFYNCPSTARGYYPAAYATEWQAAIDPSTKRWQGLLMEEIPAPVLNAPVVNEEDASINLTWSMDYSSENLRFDVYRSASSDFASASIVGENIGGKSFKDDTWSLSYSSGETLYYWVVAKDGDWEIGRSNDESVKAVVVVQTPVLKIDAVSWSDFTLTFSWGKTTDGADVTVPCSLYRGTSDDITQATCILKDSQETTYLDSAFLDVKPKTKPLYYWVVPKGSDLSAASASVKTRNRYAIAVGIENFAVDGEEMRQYWRLEAAASDAVKFAKLFGTGCDCVENIDLLTDTTSPQATKEAIRNAIADKASRAVPGDCCVLFFSTHGGNGEDGSMTLDGGKKGPCICAYDADYYLTELAEDIELFPTSVAIIGIMDVCCAASMAAFDGNTQNSWLADSRLARCKANVAWIASSEYSESALDGLFMTWFADFGWEQGYAQKKIYNSGIKDYEGGDDGKDLTYYKLAKYAQTFVKGKLGCKQHVEILGESAILQNYAGEVGKPKLPWSTQEITAAVTDLTITQGRCDFGGGQQVGEHRIGLRWSFVSGADFYCVYRTYGPDGKGEVVINDPTHLIPETQYVDKAFGESCQFDDVVCQYRIVPFNPCGFGMSSKTETGYSRIVSFSDSEWTREGQKGKSAAIGNNKTTDMTMTLDGTGEISFSWQTSCESALELHDGTTSQRDHAEFLVDGEVVATSDGESMWKQVSVNLSGGGSHTVIWRYVKDGSGSAGEDCVWVSNIQFASIDDEETSEELLDESEYNWFYEDAPTAFSNEEPFEYNPNLTPENAICQIDACIYLVAIDSSVLVDSSDDDAQAGIVKVAGATGLEYAVCTANGWTMVGNESIETVDEDEPVKVTITLDYSSVPTMVKYMISGHTLTNADGVSSFATATQKSSVQALVVKGEGTINSWAGKYEFVNSDVQTVEAGDETALCASLDTFSNETFRVTGGGTLVIASDKVPVGGINRKLHVDSNSTLKFDLSGLSTFPSVMKLFNGVGNSFAVGENMKLIVPGEGVDRVSKLFVKNGNLEARVAERPTMDGSTATKSPFSVVSDGDTSTATASIGNAVEGFWYGLEMTGVLGIGFLLDPDSVKQCTSSGSMTLESSANANSNSGFYRVSVSAEKP